MKSLKGLNLSLHAPHNKNSWYFFTRQLAIGIVMNNAICTINMPSSIKVLSLGKTINVKPAKNSKDSMPKLNAYAIPALISVPRRLL